MTDSGKPSQALRVFYSYSHKDEDLRDELDKHLSLLQRHNLIKSWHDRRIAPGSKWQGAIDSELAAADIILLLVSADFLSSDYCYDVEMQAALMRHENNEATVIPIILRPVDWSMAPFANLQALPQNAKPVTTWTNRDEAFANIAAGIRHAISERYEYEQSNQLAFTPNPIDAQYVDEPQQLFDDLLQYIRTPELLNVGSVTRLVKHIAIQLQAKLVFSDISGDLPYSEIDLHHLHVRGTHKAIPVATLWETSVNIDSLQRRVSEKAVRAFGLILCFTEELFSAVMGRGRGPNFCVLSPENIYKLATSPNAIQLLLTLMVEQIGIGRLSPYSTLLPATGSMFFGRSHELGRLIKDYYASYAVVGPSQIGKSSLLEQYHWLSVRERWPDNHARFFINMAGCPPNYSQVGRFIAQNLEATNISHRVTDDNLLSFIRHKCKRVGGRLELVLDEVDHVCSSQTFEILAQAAKEGLVRLILVGRDALMNLMMEHKSIFSSRFNSVRPGPLGREEARGVIVKPMMDLGILYQDDACVDHIIEITGRLPSLLQHYGQSLIVKIDETSTPIISMDMIEEIESQFEFINSMLRPISSLTDSSAKQTVISLLKSDSTDFTPADIAKIASDMGEELNAREVFNLCNFLCVYGLLVYEEGKFRIANLALKNLACKSGYLDLL